MKITKAVLDTSVVIKWFRTFEHDRDKALHLRNKFLDEELILAISDLLLYELANVLRYKPDLGLAEVRSIVQSVLAMKMEIRFLNSAVLSNAISFAYDYDITVYDASYISLAQNIGYSLITADDKLYKKVKEIEFVHSLAQI